VRVLGTEVRPPRVRVRAGSSSRRLQRLRSSESVRPRGLHCEPTLESRPGMDGGGTGRGGAYSQKRSRRVRSPGEQLEVSVSGSKSPWAWIQVFRTPCPRSAAGRHVGRMCAESSARLNCATRTEPLELGCGVLGRSLEATWCRRVSVGPTVRRPKPSARRRVLHPTQLVLAIDAGSKRTNVARRTNSRRPHRTLTLNVRGIIARSRGFSSRAVGPRLLGLEHAGRAATCGAQRAECARNRMPRWGQCS